MNKGKRRNGEGTVFKSANGKWIAKIRMGTRPDGKPNVKQFSARTQAEAKNKLKEFKKSREFSEKHIVNNKSLQDDITLWLKVYQRNKLKPSSYDRLESTINRHILPRLGRIKADKVTRDNIQMLINELYNQQGLSHSSIKKVYEALNSYYNHALLDDIVIKNPCKGVILPNGADTRKQVTTFTTEEIERLKTAIMNNTNCTYKYAYLLILNTGLRMGEALALLWLDINFDNKTIAVNKTVTRIKKRDENGEGIGGCDIRVQNSVKTGSGHRTIPMNKSAENALLMLKKDNNTERVIINSQQNPVLPSNFERAFQRLLQRADIDKCGVHTLRHTFASMLFSKGVDVKIISKLLGHSTTKITYDTYIHLFDEDIADVTTLLD